MGTKSLKIENRNIYCIKCYEKLFGEICDKCRKIITLGNPFKKALNKTWHNECFKCSKCFVQLNTFYTKNDKPYCSNCYNAILSISE